MFASIKGPAGEHVDMMKASLCFHLSKLNQYGTCFPLQQNLSPFFGNFYTFDLLFVTFNLKLFVTYVSMYIYMLAQFKQQESLNQDKQIK